MSQGKKTVTVRGTEIGGGKPLICTPLIGSNEEQLMLELERILPKKPDILEWRADFFQHLDDLQEVIHTASKIRGIVGDTPVLFTIRSDKEGGQPISLTEQDKIELISAVCKSKQIDIVDYELVNETEDMLYVRRVSRESGICLIGSYHNFHATPDRAFIIEKLRQAELCGADIAKVSVMPASAEDVLVLLNAAQNAQKELKIPMVAISMGGFGAITRMAGWFFGSAFTFAVGEKSSAPGQMPIEDVRSAIQLLQSSIESE